MRVVEFFGGLFSALSDASQHVAYDKCLRDHANDFSPTSSCWYLEPSDSHHSPFGW